MKELTPEELEQARKFTTFIKEARLACSKKGQVIEFICTACGGRAFAIVSRLNGHIHAKCEGCGLQVME